MTNTKEYRNELLGALNGDLKEAAIAMITDSNLDSFNKKSLGLFLANIGRLVETMMDAKGDTEFDKSARYLDQMLEEEFFSPIYGPRETLGQFQKGQQVGKGLMEHGVNPMEALSNILSDLNKGLGKQLQEEKREPKAVIKVVGGELSDIPPHIRKQIAEQLKREGAPASVIQQLEQ